MLRLLPYSSYINWIVVFMGGPSIVRKPSYDYDHDVWTSKYVNVCQISCFVVKLSEVVTLAFVVQLRCMSKLSAYGSAHCSVCPNVGTAFIYDSRNQKSELHTQTVLHSALTCVHNNNQNIL